MPWTFWGTDTWSVFGGPGLVPGKTLIEVAGELGLDGVLEASIVFIEDQNEGDHVEEDVKIEGWITGTDDVSEELQLRLGDLEKRADIVSAELGLPLPGGIAIDTAFWP